MRKFSIEKRYFIIDLFYKHKIISITLIFIFCILFIIILVKHVTDGIYRYDDFHYETILEVSPFIGDLDDSCITKSYDPSISEAKLETDRGFPGYSFVIYFYRPGVNQITLSKGDVSVTFEVTIDENYNFQVRKLQF